METVLSSVISTQFTLVCVPQPKITKISLNHPILGVQNCSRSSMLILMIPMKSSSAMLVKISSMYVPITLDELTAAK